MKRISIALAGVAVAILGATRATAQSMDDLNLQVHGYAIQGFIYSTDNNWNTADSTDGSAAWTEAVVNVVAQPQPKLLIGMQVRYYLLGDYGNAITLDWAEADYKVNEYFGIRAGKVKTPVGLLNQAQDIDPVQLWALLPQSIYPIASRNSILAHYGAVAYGTLGLGESLGKLEYHGFGGARVLGGNDGFFQPLRDRGLVLPNGLSGPILGGAITWHTPIEGLTLGATDSLEHPAGDVVSAPGRGTIKDSRINIPYFFARYDHMRLMVAAEYNRITLASTTQLPAVPAIHNHLDQRAFYMMASYRFASRLAAGLYYSSSNNKRAAFTSARYQKDWALSTRYDFNPFLYLKLEQHFIDGTELGYSTSDNAGLKPNSRMTLVKLGVSF